jgi:hypothetical protein
LNSVANVAAIGTMPQVLLDRFAVLESEFTIDKSTQIVTNLATAHGKMLPARQ